MISWCSHTLHIAASVSRGYGYGYRAWVGLTITWCLRGSASGRGSLRAAALRVTDELKTLRADRSSLIIPMAERGGCYG